MSVGQKMSAGKRSASLKVIVVAVSVLLVFIGFVAYMSQSSGNSTSITVPKTELTRWIEGLAAQSGGDFNKLSPEDQQKLQRATRGQGEMMLKMLAPKK